ncbi:hypothetical protein GURASL_20050 [Geotalea uraniireducens]|uniref:Leucine rich repeat variant n=1 Tax=Geotalea uraniireducens TaxID=351604 RepID=A0ABM8EM26_9BACT|nr:hypothetical protein GURASL_20050 [Geotalea uraniireducens]
MRVIQNDLHLAPEERVTVLFLLAGDSDPVIHTKARAAFRNLPDEILDAVLQCHEAHPKLLNALARLHFGNVQLASRIAGHPHCDDETLAFLATKGIVAERHQRGAGNQSDEPATEGAEGEDDIPVDEESEEFKSKYQLSQIMGVAEKIKFAQTGDKEWRMILIKDANKLVSGTVVKNPRITEAEVLAILKSSIQNDEILRIICANKEWVKNYQIRKALVENVKTPLPMALRFLMTLNEKDLASLAKSKNVQSVLSTQARKILLNKKKDR